MTGLAEDRSCVRQARLLAAPVPERLLDLGSRMFQDLRAARAAAVLPIGVVAPGDDPEATTASLHRAGAVAVLSDIRKILEVLP